MFSKLGTICSVSISSLSLCLLIGSIQQKSAQAAIISLENPGFEIPEQTDQPFPGAGFFDFNTPPGWGLYDPNGLIPEDASLATSFTGGWKPSVAFFPTIPEGDQIGTIFLVPPGAGEVGFTQNSDTIIQPNTTYTLSVAVLNTPALPGAEIFAGFPGYRLELLAENTVIATDNNSVVVSEGGFETATVSYTSANDDIYLGESLGIRLINPNLNNASGLDGGNGIEVNFDDVELRATSVPEPISVLGHILSGITLIFIKKRRIEQ
ncbi:MAG: hypothetical protein QNJ54_35065 [Prochloraceae cyanobacterium]|nr:hypothetical protein [Prochloraceae cyanobacterium]